MAWEDTILDEAHVKGVTALREDVPPAWRGKYRGLTAPAVIDHLKRLGVTTIELLPIARVLRGETHSAIRDARNDRAHGDRDAIERPSEDVVALVDGAEDSIVADANAFERHFEQRLVIRRLLTSH